MVFAFLEDGTLVIHENAADACRKYEGIDVESGVVHFIARVDLAPPSGSPSHEDEHDHLPRAGGTSALDIEEDIKRPGGLAEQVPVQVWRVATESSPTETLPNEPPAR